jgi:predicted nucleotidyltransferase
MKKQSKRTTVLTREQVISILKKELPYLKDKYGVERIVLYGSFAKGSQKKKSDIDILVDLHKTLGLKFIELADMNERPITLQK